jgi:hypothetical protein
MQISMPRVTPFTVNLQLISISSSAAFHDNDSYRNGTLVFGKSIACTYIVLDRIK